jgi:thiol-disulfide isomerase/thioredoxin
MNTLNATFCLAISMMLAGIMFTSKAQAQDKTPDQVLLGPITIEQLLDFPDWFGADFISFDPSKYYCDQIVEKMSDVSFVCVLGTWCGDAKREVPRLIKVLQAVNFDPKNLKMYGVDRNKIAPGGEQAQYSVEKVPTIILFRNGKELGRIVEQTSKSMEQDILAILEGRDPAEKPAPAPAPADDGAETKDK